MMAENPDPVLATVRAAVVIALASPFVGAAFWGGAGGLTNALVIRVTALEALRHVAIGALVAAGLGGLALPIVSHWLGLPAGVISRPDGAGIGSGFYLTGSLGGAAFEVILKRIRSGKLPNEKA